MRAVRTSDASEAEMAAAVAPLGTVTAAQTGAGTHPARAGASGPVGAAAPLARPGSGWFPEPTDPPALPDIVKGVSCSRADLKTFCKKHVIDLIATAIMLGITIGTITVDAFESAFIERDPALSFPILHETVPEWALYCIIIVVPVLQILIARNYRRRHALRRKRFNSIPLVLLAMVQTQILVIGTVAMLKLYFGRHRPNFFAKCNYAGYADALKTGDFTAYNAATEAGRLGSLDKCLEPAATVRSGLSSFPSGHAAQSTAGLVFAPTYVYYAVPVMKRSARMLKGIALGVPVVLLVIVAGSRFRDHFHNADDVFAGVLVGLAGVRTVFSFHYGRTIEKMKQQNMDIRQLHKELRRDARQQRATCRKHTRGSEDAEVGDGMPASKTPRHELRSMLRDAAAMVRSGTPQRFRSTRLSDATDAAGRAPRGASSPKAVRVRKIVASERPPSVLVPVANADDEFDADVDADADADTNGKTDFAAGGVFGTGSGASSGAGGGGMAGHSQEAGATAGAV